MYILWLESYGYFHKLNTETNNNVGFASVNEKMEFDNLG